MAQLQIEELLKKAKKPLTSKDIMKFIGVCYHTVSRQLRKLKKKGRIVEMRKNSGRLERVYSVVRKR